MENSLAKQYLIHELHEYSKIQPTILTDRLILRPFQFSDAPAIFNYARKESVAQHTTFSPHQSEKDAEDYLLNFVLAAYRKGDMGPLAITMDHHVIGAIELRLDESHDRIHAREIGYVLDDTMWGKGIVSEAVKAMIDYCFHHYPLVYRIFGCVLEKNVGSYKVLEKAHCVREGVERSARIIDDHFENVFYYSLLRPEWQNGSSQTLAGSNSRC